MAYFVGTPISQTNETMGRCPYPKRARNSSDSSSSIMDSTSKFSALAWEAADDSSSVYHIHKSFTSNLSLGRIHYRYQADY
jgi:hypothetical protein